MTSILMGGGRVSQFLTIRGGGYLISILKNSDRGRGGVKNTENLADVICTWPLRMVACKEIPKMNLQENEDKGMGSENKEIL